MGGECSSLCRVCSNCWNEKLLSLKKIGTYAVVEGVTSPGPAILEEMVGVCLSYTIYIYLPEEDGLGVERRLKKESYFATTTMEEHSFNERAAKDYRHTVIVIAYPHIPITSDMTPLNHNFNRIKANSI